MKPRLDEARAREICDSLLEITGEAILSDDFAAFAECFHLPHLIETAEEKRSIGTRDELHAIFRSGVANYRKRGVTRLVRMTDAAAFRGETRIEASYLAHAMAGDLRVSDPVPAFSVLEYRDGKWKCAHTQYAAEKTTIIGQTLAATARSD